METRWRLTMSSLCILIFATTTTAQFVVNSRQSDQQQIRVTTLDQLSSPDLSANSKIDQLKLLPDKMSTQRTSSESTMHSRQKRMVWLTDDGRLALPPGTVLSIAPTISLPLVRYPPSGFLSNLTMSFPLTSELILKYVNDLNTNIYVYLQLTLINWD